MTPYFWPCFFTVLPLFSLCGKRNTLKTISIINFVSFLHKPYLANTFKASFSETSCLLTQHKAMKLVPIHKVKVLYSKAEASQTTQHSHAHHRGWNSRWCHCILSTSAYFKMLFQMQRLRGTERLYGPSRKINVAKVEAAIWLGHCHSALQCCEKFKKLEETLDVSNTHDDLSPPSLTYPVPQC